MSSSWSYLDPVVLPLLKGTSVLDAGCGMGRWGALIESNYWEAKLPEAPAVDGFDVFAPNVEHCRGRGVYRRVWEHRMPEPLEGRWDTVLAVEILEHLPQQDVAPALAALEAAARERVIVSTPNGPAYRDGHDTPTGFNRYEAHVSAIDVGLLRGHGYHVRGVGLGRYGSRLAAWAKRAGARTTLTTAPWRLPQLAETLVAYKDVG